MYICMYVWMYVCMYVCIYAINQVQISMYVVDHVYISVVLYVFSMHVCMYVWMNFIQVDVAAYAWICMWVYTNLFNACCKYIYSSISMYVCMYVYICTIKTLSLYMYVCMYGRYIVMECLDSDLHRIIQSKQVLSESHYKHFLHQVLHGGRIYLPKYVYMYVYVCMYVC